MSQSHPQASPPLDRYLPTIKCASFRFVSQPYSRASRPRRFQCHLPPLRCLGTTRCGTALRINTTKILQPVTSKLALYAKSSSESKTKLYDGHQEVKVAAPIAARPASAGSEEVPGVEGSEISQRWVEARHEGAYQGRCRQGEVI